MAFRSVAVPLLSGGALLIGYAAFAWLRPKRRGPIAVPEPREALAPLFEQLEQLPEHAALDTTCDPPLDDRAAARPSQLGALFLARASGALSPFEFGPSSKQRSVAR